MAPERFSLRPRPESRVKPSLPRIALNTRPVTPANSRENRLPRKTIIYAISSMDLIFANAALHFVPNHHEFMVRLVSFLHEGGRLAVQMPNNIQELSHALMRMVAADGPWAKRLVPIAKTRPVIGALDLYYQLLTPVCSKIDIWQTTYVHPLDGPDDIVDWFEGSGLRPFLEPLSPCEREAFLSRYRAELSAAYPKQPDGKVLLRYPRLFFVAQKC